MKKMARQPHDTESDETLRPRPAPERVNSFRPAPTRRQSPAPGRQPAKER